jgi:hypothetical protein
VASFEVREVWEVWEVWEVSATCFGVRRDGTASTVARFSIRARSVLFES